MKRMVDVQHVTGCIGGCERYGCRADDGSIEERDGEQCCRSLTDLLMQPRDYTARVREVAELRAARKKGGSEGHHRHGADDHHANTDHKIHSFVLDEVRCDAFVD